MQWLQEPNQSNVDNQNTVRCKARRHFGTKKGEYRPAKTEELETNNKIKKYQRCQAERNAYSRATSAWAKSL